MLKKEFIRLKDLRIRNLKSVKNGQINCHDYEYERGLSSCVIGIYGQNGSGKTTIVDAISIMRDLLSGVSLCDDIVEYISNDAKEMHLNFIFDATISESRYDIYYDVIIKKSGSSAIVSFEQVSLKSHDDELWPKKSIIFTYDIEEDKYIIQPKTTFKTLIKEKKFEVEIDLKVARKLSTKDCTSFLFSNDVFNIFEQISDDKVKKVYEIMNALKFFSTKDLFIIKNDKLALMNLNVVFPVNFRVTNNDKVMQGEIGLPIMRPEVIPEEIYNVVCEVVEQMNIVLKTIVPGLQIEIYSHGNELMEDGNAGVRVEILAKRGENKISLRYESEGIKKIVSILSLLIMTYNNPTVCLVVDELDAGIFEYLLGQILNIFAKNGKGQLIFTSHNLRPLEVLESKFIYFTTVNKNNMYLKMKNVKANNNLRDMYYRTIQLGGGDETLYNETDDHEIRKAFRKAGRLINE